MKQVNSADMDVGKFSPSAESTLEELERVLVSQKFIHSKRLCALLRYLVTEELAGRGERIKATSITIDLYGRDDTFDQQSDTIMRVEAGRLRRQLENYYATSAENHSLTISIPRGTYRPLFSPALDRGHEQPLPLTEAADTSPDEKIRRKKLGMLAVLSTVALIAVAWILTNNPGTTTPHTKKPFPERKAKELSVAIQPDERGRISNSQPTTLEALALYRQALIMLIPPNDMARILTARSFFQRARELDAGFAGGYAGESFSHSIPLLFLKAADPELEVAQVISLAAQAIEVNPDFGMGYATLSFAQIFAGDQNRGLANARQAVAIQPGDAFAQFILGVNLVVLGRPEDTIAPLLQAVRLDPLEPRTPYRNVRGIAFYAAGQYTGAHDMLEENLQGGGPRGPHMNVFIAAAYAQLGRNEEARDLLTRTMRAHPNFPIQAWLKNWLERGDQLEATLGLLGELSPG